MSAAIEYIATGGKLGVRERVELDEALMGGESTTGALAERFEVDAKTIERRRKKLRGLGFPCLTPPLEIGDANREARSVRRRLQNERRRDRG